MPHHASRSLRSIAFALLAAAAPLGAAHAQERDLELFQMDIRLNTIQLDPAVLSSSNPERVRADFIAVQAQ